MGGTVVAGKSRMPWPDKGQNAADKGWRDSYLSSAVAHEIKDSEDESNCAQPAAAGVPDDLKVLAGLALGLAISGIPFSCLDLQADIVQSQKQQHMMCQPQ